MMRSRPSTQIKPTGLFADAPWDDMARTSHAVSAGRAGPGRRRAGPSPDSCATTRG
jgi:hypothetical protein